MATRLCVAQTLKVNALTQTEYNFNSMARVNGKLLCADESGLYVLGGTDFDGTAIASYFEFTVDFGIQVQIDMLFIGMKTTGQMQVTITMDEATANARTYTIDPANTSLHEHTVSVDTGADDWGRFVTFRFANLSGCDFSIDQIEAVIVPLGRIRVW